MYKIGKTIRNKPFLMVDGYSYYKKRENKTCQVWRCCERSKFCSAVAFTPKNLSESGQSADFAFKNEHNHPQNTNMATRILVRNDINKKAIESNDPPREIIGNALRRKTISEIFCSGTQAALEQAINRRRREKMKGLK